MEYRTIKFLQEEMKDFNWCWVIISYFSFFMVNITCILFTPERPWWSPSETGARRSPQKWHLAPPASLQALSCSGLASWRAALVPIFCGLTDQLYTVFTCTLTQQHVDAVKVSENYVASCDSLLIVLMPVLRPCWERWRLKKHTSGKLSAPSLSCLPTVCILPNLSNSMPFPEETYLMWATPLLWGPLPLIEQGNLSFFCRVLWS